MAKTNRKKAASPTVHNAAALKVAKEIFGAHSELDEVHITSDGTAFGAACDARNHARTLKNKEVVSLKRADLAVATSEEEISPKDNEQAAEASDDAPDANTKNPENE